MMKVNNKAELKAKIEKAIKKDVAIVNCQNKKRIVLKRNGTLTM